jgi:hypothetical protein
MGKDSRSEGAAFVAQILGLTLVVVTACARTSVQDSR